MFSFITQTREGFFVFNYPIPHFLEKATYFETRNSIYPIVTPTYLWKEYEIAKRLGLG